MKTYNETILDFEMVDLYFKKYFFVKTQDFFKY